MKSILWMVGAVAVTTNKPTMDRSELMKPVIITDDDLQPFQKAEHLYPPEYEGHFDSLVMTYDTIRKRVRELARILHEDFRGARPMLICTLKGACPFYAHLTDELKELRQGFDMEFVRATSYSGTSTTGTVQFLGELNVEHVRGRHVIVVEDILDTGTTLAAIVPMIREQASPASVEVCTLLDKRLPTKQYHAKYVGFSIPEKFIVGYGLDYNELYRDLKDIFVISRRGIDFDGAQLYP